MYVNIFVYHCMKGKNDTCWFFAVCVHKAWNTDCKMHAIKKSCNWENLNLMHYYVLYTMIPTCKTLIVTYLEANFKTCQCIARI